MTNIVSNITTNIPQETINSIFIDILKGAKNVGSDIYGVSKTGIIKAVDFAQEQAPLVVQEFLAWKFASAAIYATFAIIGVLILMSIFYKCYKMLKKDDEIAFVGMLVTCLLCIPLIVNGIFPNVEQMAKVKIAPRVYLIEWISNQVDSSKHIK